MGVRASRSKAGILTRTLAPTMLRNEIRGHELREQMILDSGLDWTIVRAPILTNGGLTKRYRTEQGAVSATFAPKLSRADVAHSMLGQLSQSRVIQNAVDVLPYQ